MAGATQLDCNHTGNDREQLRESAGGSQAEGRDDLAGDGDREKEVSHSTWAPARRAHSGPECAGHHDLEAVESVVRGAEGADGEFALQGRDRPHETGPEKGPVCSDFARSPERDSNS